jgi:hypothetical protein
MNKLCDVACCWIYIGILLRAHPILHISRIRVKEYDKFLWLSRKGTESEITAAAQDEALQTSAMRRVYYK